MSSGDIFKEEPKESSDNPDIYEKPVKTEYELTMEKVKKLNKLAKNYVREKELEMSAGELTCLYIRSEQYDSSNWQILAGKRNMDFEKYVEKKTLPFLSFGKHKTLFFLPGKQ